MKTIEELLEKPIVRKDGATNPDAGWEYGWNHVSEKDVIEWQSSTAGIDNN